MYVWFGAGFVFPQFQLVAHVCLKSTVSLLKYRFVVSDVVCLTGIALAQVA